VNRPESQPTPQEPHPSGSPDTVLIRPWLLPAQRRSQLGSDPAIKPADAALLAGRISDKAAFRPILINRAMAQPAPQPVGPVVHPVGLVVHPVGPAPPPVPAPPQAPGFHDAQILAFLCRPLPKMPDPLPNLVFNP